MATEKSITEKKIALIDMCARFRFLAGSKAGKEVRIERETFFIGRGPNNNLVLSDRSVSRKHAVLNYMDGHFILSDLNSTKGIYVNGQKTTEMRLHDRDRIKIGGDVLEFLEGGSSAPLDVKTKKRVLLMVAAAILVVIVIILVVLTGGKKEKGVDLELMREIEYNYSQGVNAYNLEKNIESARVYWQRVLELDPSNTTTQARNTRQLLKNLPPNLPSNPGGAESR